MFSPRSLLFAVPLLFVAHVTFVSATPSYFDTTCAACHITVSATCSGCHAHGVHGTPDRTGINLAAATDRTSYGAGDPVSVTVTGGDQGGWVRVILYDQEMREVARSTGPDGIGGGGGFPVVLTAPAPAKSGTFRWSAAWYGSRSDAPGGAFGSRWIADRNNADHGEEVVETNEFTVVSGPTSSIRLEPGAVPFGMTPVGSSSTRGVQVVNDGTAELVVSSIALCPGTGSEFTWAPSSLMIPPGGREVLQITHTPFGQQQGPACLRLTTNDPERTDMLLPLIVSSGARGR